MPSCPTRTIDAPPGDDPVNVVGGVTVLLLEMLLFRRSVGELDDADWWQCR